MPDHLTLLKNYVTKVRRQLSQVEQNLQTLIEHLK